MLKQQAVYALKKKLGKDNFSHETLIFFHVKLHLFFFNEKLQDDNLHRTGKLHWNTLASQKPTSKFVQEKKKQVKSYSFFVSLPPFLWCKSCILCVISRESAATSTFTTY